MNIKKRNESKITNAIKIFNLEDFNFYYNENARKPKLLLYLKPPNLLQNFKSWFWPGLQLEKLWLMTRPWYYFMFPLIDHIYLPSISVNILTTEILLNFQLLYITSKPFGLKIIAETPLTLYINPFVPNAPFLYPL